MGLGRTSRCASAKSITPVGTGATPEAITLSLVKSPWMTRRPRASASFRLRSLGELVGEARDLPGMIAVDAKRAEVGFQQHPRDFGQRQRRWSLRGDVNAPGRLVVPTKELADLLHCRPRRPAHCLAGQERDEFPERAAITRP
jgi:hypothetical protein